MAEARVSFKFWRYWLLLLLSGLCPVLFSCEFNGARNEPCFEYGTSQTERQETSGEELSDNPFLVKDPEFFRQRKDKSDFGHRQLDIPANSENNNNQHLYLNRDIRFERYEDERDFKGWKNNLNEKSPVWSAAGKNPNGKTIPLPSFPTLDIVEDPGYDHNRPKWPLNEYLSDKFNSFYPPSYFGTRNNKTEEEPATGHNKQYEWQQLQPLRNKYSSSGDINYDRKKYFHLDEEDQTLRNKRYRHGHSYVGHKNPLLAGHTTTVSTSTDVKESESTQTQKHGYIPGQYGHRPYFPPDYYPKKRFRLSIHPGYIAAPIAGLAAFGAASVLTKKPLLFELGLVNNKFHYAPDYPHQNRPVHYPGHGWASNVVPVVPGYPHVNPPVITSGTLGHTPTFPVLKPEASHHSHVHHHHTHGLGSYHHRFPNELHNHNHPPSHGHHGHQGWGEQGGHHHQQHHEPEKKPWWNPFAALTPRD